MNDMPSVGEAIFEYSSVIWVIASHQFTGNEDKKKKFRHFADISKYISFNENLCVLILISLKFVLNDSFNNKSSQIQVMGRRRTGDKPLSEWMMP